MVLISVTTPPSDPTIHKHVCMVTDKLLLYKKYKTTVIRPSHNPYENNLNKIVKDFLAGDYIYWLNIDRDNPPINNPFDLIELNKDIIGLPTPVWHFDEPNHNKGDRPIYWNAWDYVPEKDGYKEHNPKDGLQEVDAVGTGCLLIHRRVFENEEMQKGPFLRQWNKDGTMYKGNDISFCERAKRQGFKIYAHFDYPCLHFNNLELTEILRAFKQMYE